MSAAGPADAMDASSPPEPFAKAVPDRVRLYNMFCMDVESALTSTHSVRLQAHSVWTRGTRRNLVKKTVPTSTTMLPLRMLNLSSPASLPQDNGSYRSPQNSEPVSSPSLCTTANSPLTLPLQVLARELMHSLPTAAVSELVREANHRLHFDPVVFLPHEIIQNIFEHLHPKSLHVASLASRTWKHRANDPRLWRQLFLREGWACNDLEVRALEDVAKAYKRRSLQETIAILDQLHAQHQRLSFRHSGLPTPGLDGEVDGALDLPDMLLDIGIPPAPIAHPSFSGDVEMQDISALQPPTPFISASPPLSYPRFSKILTMDPIFDHPTLNWQYIYSQRRRLERNWFAGKFTNFRLPHPNYPDEAHTQCVYTIQFSNNHLVSGSRDKSVRVWDLRTQRLRLPPLEGHTGSVLCLQFDDRPEQDIIVSGGSDADVIVWRFSDGSMIKRMTSAHSESVLNLRFDERYLVTCSKDKTIKVWNRHSLHPTHPDYPHKGKLGPSAYCPAHIIDIKEIEINPNLSSHILEPFSHLMTFDGHGAAVNALQIRDYEIVSASGDRKVILWNIKTGALVRVYSGHTKGIACIQYDGRRIVSGSSDNTVRIFDAATSAEVATLDGHRNLVRTVQAEFGDLAVDNSANEADARAHEKKLLEAETEQRLHGEGSKKPGPKEEDMYLVGAKLPPGGGGTQWSKIVSGSYDETLIIWRRDKNGRWYIAKELRQEDALRTSARRTSSQLDMHRRQPGEDMLTLHSQHTSETLRHRLQQNQWQMLQLQQQHRQALLDSLGPHSRHQPMPPFVNGNSSTRTAATAAAAAAAAAAATTATTSADQAHMTTHSAQPPLAPTQAPALPMNLPPNHHAQHHPPRPPGIHAQGSSPAGQQGPANHPWSSGMQRPVRPPHHHHPHSQHHHLQAAAAGQVPSLNNRVFKLQFDARRIICCSQEPIIVGWDFANGDKEIEEVCRFFGEPS